MVMWRKRLSRLNRRIKVYLSRIVLKEKLCEIVTKYTAKCKC